MSDVARPARTGAGPATLRHDPPGGAGGQPVSTPPDRTVAPAAPAPERDARTRTGEVVHLRPIAAEDAAGLVAFHAGLSAYSVYLRFFSFHPCLTEREVERFTRVDGRDRLALVVEVGGRLLGVGRYERVPATRDAEVAFVVADDRQGEGIGMLLADELAHAARGRGIDAFVADTLAENGGMLGVFFGLGFPVTSSYAGGVIRVRFPIEPTPTYLERLADREAARAPTRAAGGEGDLRAARSC